MMRINVRLYGTLREQLPLAQRGRTTLTLPAGATAADALGRLGIHDPVLIAINEAHTDDVETPLHDGDNLLVFEFTAGG